MSETREVLSWDGFGAAAREIAQAVVDSGFAPDVVIAVARGGLPVGGAVSYAMGVKAIGTLNVEFYTAVGETLPEPVLLSPEMDLTAIEGLKALVVDDVADTGETLAMVKRLMAERCEEVRTAVLYRKPQSIIDPDYAWKVTDDWIVFPWSAEPPVTGAANIDA